MAKQVEKYDGHRFDDIFYAYSQLFLKGFESEVSWLPECYGTNFEQVSAFPIKIVRPYVERLLQLYGSGPLIHTIIAANLECKSMPPYTGPFGVIALNTVNDYMFTMPYVGLTLACGIHKIKDADFEYKCVRCETTIFALNLNIYESFRQHAKECEMSIDGRYFKTLTSFCSTSHREAYLNFLYKSVAQTMLKKLGSLIIKQGRFEATQKSALMDPRVDSLSKVLVHHNHLGWNNESLDRMAQAGYHTLYNQKPVGWMELKEMVKDFVQTPVANRKLSCFSCHHEVTLSAELVSDPWKVHAKMSPSCSFLLMKMGRRYVTEVQKSMNGIGVFTEVIDPELNLRPSITPMGEIFDLTKGVTERKTTELRVALSTTKVSSCMVCCSTLSTVALMSCSHLATCVDCTFATRLCPLCRMFITGYIMPVYQPDGSFWKQPDCVGGNFFINLPCCHLIETCVPDNVKQCPKADAVEEDTIYCVVCGYSNLGKLKIYF